MVPDYRVLVTGSREWADRNFLRAVLDVANDGMAPLLVIHGANPNGADALAEEWCRDNGVASDPHPANWKRLGKAAGSARNQVMADEGADVCYAFYWPGAANKGTADMAERAEKAGIPVRRFYGTP